MTEGERRRINSALSYQGHVRAALTNCHRWPGAGRKQDLSLREALVDPEGGAFFLDSQDHPSTLSTLMRDSCPQPPDISKPSHLAQRCPWRLDDHPPPPSPSSEYTLKTTGLDNP